MRQASVFPLLALILLTSLLGCSDDNFSSVQIPPTVRILAPADGEELTGPVTIRVEATDNAAVDWVYLYLDGALFAEFEEPPYEVEWNAGYWADGALHYLQAEATDPTYNVGVSELVTVSVASSAASTPTTQAAVVDAESPWLVDLGWQSLVDAERYELEVLPAGAGAHTTHAVATADTGLSIQALQAGSYSWRVRAQESHERWGPWSPPGGNFIIARDYCRSHGGAAEDAGYAMTPTADGGYVLTGFSRSEGAGDRDLWLLKVNSQGSTQWSRRFGGAGDDWGFAVIQTADGGYAAVGHTQSPGAGDKDLWLIRTDAAGGEVWTRNFGGSGDDTGYAILEPEAEHFLLAGSTSSQGWGNGDGWLLLYDAPGDSLVWESNFGGTGQDEFRGMVLDAGGEIALAGNTASAGAGGGDAWLLKASAAGDSLWARTFGGGGWDGAHDLCLGADGGYALAGFNGSVSSGPLDLWLIKTNAEGEQEWTRLRGGEGWDLGYAIVETGGGYVLAGYSNSFGLGDYDLWLLRTNGNGEPDWDRRLGGGFDDRGLDLAPRGSGWIATGYTRSFGAGDFDLWLVGAESDGEPSSWP